MSTETISLRDCIYIKRSPNEHSYVLHKDKKQREMLVYFIPGNPGLIEYYYDFLTHLASLFDPNLENYVYHIVGYSLGGFELQDGTTGVEQLEAMLYGTVTRRISRPQRTLTLVEQQAHVFDSLCATIPLLQKQHSPADASESIPVILAGHSVGAYIMMMNISWRQWCQDLKANETDGNIELFASILSQQEALSHLHCGHLWALAADSGFEMIGGVGLFPTIVDLAGSPRGRKLGPLARWTWFAYVMHLLAYTLKLLPGSVVCRLVEYITGMPHTAAETTTEFLRSSNGVYQALSMARNELLEMRTDKWPDVTWNRYQPATTMPIDRPQLYFFWGENDHWIKNSTRDQIIANHARRAGIAVADDRGRPYMEVDNNNIPHDFCIRPEHSARVANKVRRFVMDAIATSPSRSS